MVGLVTSCGIGFRASRHAFNKHMVSPHNTLHKRNPVFCEFLHASPQPKELSVSYKQKQHTATANASNMLPRNRVGCGRKPYQRGQSKVATTKGKLLRNTNMLRYQTRGAQSEATSRVPLDPLWKTDNMAMKKPGIGVRPSDTSCKHILQAPGMYLYA